MSGAGLPARAHLSIGEVLAELRSEFPDVTISKIRFLESEGLIQPERTPSGYRKFAREDVARLRYVLSQQRDHYLPLRVIKENLDAIDLGLEPPNRPGGSAQGPRRLMAAADLPGPEEFLPEPGEVRMSREELLTAAGLQPAALDALEQAGLIVRRGKGSHYDGDALVVARTVVEMGRFGIEPRHLRPYRATADREVGLFQQVVSPMLRQRNPEGRARAEESVRELAALSVRLHATLIRAGLRAELGG
ncbi:MAG TPA: MerR family transcriptional regulator [Mycobacteriales bacterium]|nr:MerR family transcriptional regulator [Mycobacteriales bacterium]